MTAHGVRRTTGAEADDGHRRLLSAFAYGLQRPDPSVRGAANTLELAAAPESVKAARDFAGALLRAWGLAAMCDDVGLVVSELVTNALRYAAATPGDLVGEAPFRLGLFRSGGWLTCAVTDPSDEVPVPRQPGFAAQTGRGLHLVEAFSDSWNWMALHDRGKIVWACFLL